MLKKNLIILLAFLVMELPLSLSCSNSNNDGRSNSASGDTDNDIKYVTLSMASKNAITRGKDIFDTVMKKYQPVIDFYGENSEDFKKLVNTNLLYNTNTENPLVAPAERLYSYDSLSLWGGSEFVVRYDDGTSETLPAAEMLTINGDATPEWFKEGKKITGFLAKLADAEKARSDTVGKLEKISGEVKKIDVLSGLSDDLEGLAGDFDQLKNLTKCLSAVGQVAGVFGAAFGLAESLGLFDTGPSADEVINMKLDHIISLLNGVYTHLEYIENRLDEIEYSVMRYAGISIELDLDTIKNNLDGLIDELNFWTIDVNKDNVDFANVYEMKKTIAKEYLMIINGYLENYINYSMQDYKNFIDYKSNPEMGNDPNYIPAVVKIQVPSGYHFNWKTGTLDIVYNILPSENGFRIHNPVKYLPFSYEGLEYLKNLIWTRLNLNSFIVTDEEVLNEINSNTVSTYLRNNYIAKLRNLFIDEIYKEDPNTGNLYKDIGDIYKSVFTDAFDTYDAGIIIENWFGIEIIRNPYFGSPSLEIGSQSIAMSQPSRDGQFFDPVFQILKAYYISKTSSLMEFTASLAAFEIQLAAYLDDEAYESYRK